MNELPSLIIRMVNKIIFQIIALYIIILHWKMIYLTLFFLFNDVFLHIKLEV